MNSAYSVKLILPSLLILLILFVVTAYGREDYSYHNTASLLEIGTGARPLGLGGAFVGLADDENAVFYNPAGLAFLEEIGVTSLFSRQFSTFNYSSLGIAGQNLGINLLQLDSGKIEVTDKFGIPAGESFRYLSRAGIGSIGLTFNESAALGMRIKYYQSALSRPIDKRGGGWALDTSLMLRGDSSICKGALKDLRIGIMYENLLSQQITFDEDHSENWITDLRWGLSITLELLKETSLNVVLDFNNLLHESFESRLGVELWMNSLGIRAGLNYQGVSMGTSIWINNMRIDWAHTTHYSSLPDDSRFSATIRF